MNPKQTDRRRFLKNGAALAGLAVGASATALPAAAAAEPALEKVDELHLYGERSHFVTAVRNGSINNPERRLKDEAVAFGLRTPLQDSVGMITPSSLHFTISHGFEPPDIDPQEHHLLIHGMVDRPLIFSVDELKRLPFVTRFHFVECHGNSSPRGPGGDARISADATPQETHGFTSCSQWTGVLLSTLLKEAGVQKSATWIIAEGADEPKHSKSIPIGKALDDALVAYGQNGEPVRPEQGFPLRLIVPGWQGINNVKWLRRVDLVDEPYMAMMETSRYPSMTLDGKSRWFEFTLGPKSVITRPAGGYKMPGPGFHEITGLAWSGDGRRQARRSLHRWRPHVEGRDAPRSHRAQSAHSIFRSVDLGRQRVHPAIPLHGRHGNGPADGRLKWPSSGTPTWTFSRKRNRSWATSTPFNPGK